VCSVGVPAAPTTAAIVTRNFVKHIAQNTFASKYRRRKINCIFRQIVFAIIIVDAEAAKVASVGATKRLNYEYNRCFLSF